MKEWFTQSAIIYNTHVMAHWFTNEINTWGINHNVWKPVITGQMDDIMSQNNEVHRYLHASKHVCIVFCNAFY